MKKYFVCQLPQKEVERVKAELRKYYEENLVDKSEIEEILENFENSKIVDVSDLLAEIGIDLEI